MLTRIDEKLFNRIHSITNKHNGIGKWMAVITWLSSKVFFALYIGFILIMVFKKDLILIPFIMGPSIAYFITKIIRNSFKRERPFVKLNIKNYIEHAENSSFPSMHAMSAFSIATAVFLVNPTIGIIAFCVAILTGISRIIVGVHFPLDVLVGGIIGYFVTYIVFLLIQ
ncbi:undecaprenyl-diphosphatase [Natranaerovirga pectinivora]|uniref:Undecaprenyl-diphosphatase n=1 Tax=Natranaerovirga pectinivora TaxID=682400 RepID=A0A4R3MGD0_9FIRM|nr:phosphatase PAP2 family protein [Natranaerovirga pectinivora]TCT12143.1 undecaprenyl-diphosphatase [Natranaerovirga pectinivora]